MKIQLAIDFWIFGILLATVYGIIGVFAIVKFLFAALAPPRLAPMSRGSEKEVRHDITSVGDVIRKSDVPMKELVLDDNRKAAIGDLPVGAGVYYGSMKHYIYHKDQYNVYLYTERDPSITLRSHPANHVSWHSLKNRTNRLATAGCIVNSSHQLFYTTEQFSWGFDLVDPLMIRRFEHNSDFFLKLGIPVNWNERTNEQR